jgi:hypothetical protein
VSQCPSDLQVIDAALKLIKAMRLEKDAMPKSHEAPKTTDAAGILVEMLKARGDL